MPSLTEPVLSEVPLCLTEALSACRSRIHTSHFNTTEYSILKNNVFRQLRLCLRGRRSCEPTGASVAGAKLLLEHQQVAQGREWLHLAPAHAFLSSSLPPSCTASCCLFPFDLILHCSLFPSSHPSHLFPAPVPPVHPSVPSPLPRNTHRFLSFLSLALFERHSLYKRMFYAFVFATAPPVSLLTNCSHVA